jgi:hypothetical protein
VTLAESFRLARKVGQNTEQLKQLDVESRAETS